MAASNRGAWRTAGGSGRPQGRVAGLIPLPENGSAAVVEGLMCCRPGTLAEVVQFLRGEAAIPPKQVDLQQLFSLKDDGGEDFCEVRGQDHAKRAIEVAAAGSHNLLMIAHPAQARPCWPVVNPVNTALGFDEVLETTAVFKSAVC